MILNDRYAEKIRPYNFEGAKIGVSDRAVNGF